MVKADNVDHPDKTADNANGGGMSDDYADPQVGTVASLNNDNSLTVLLGGKSGDTNVKVNGLSADKFGSEVSVEAEESPWYGADTAVKVPTQLFTGNLKVNNGSVTVPVKDMKLASGYRLVIKKLQVQPELIKSITANLILQWEFTKKQKMQIQLQVHTWFMEVMHLEENLNDQTVLMPS